MLEERQGVQGTGEGRALEGGKKWDQHGEGKGKKIA